MRPREHVGGLAHVDDAAVPAAADDGLIDFTPRAWRPGARVDGRYGKNDTGGNDGGGADPRYTFAYRVRVGMVLRCRAPALSR